MKTLQKAQLVNFYFTPYALVLVLIGVWAVGWTFQAKLSLVLVGFTALSNLTLVDLAKLHASHFQK